MSDARRFCIIFDRRAENDGRLQQAVDRIRELGHAVFVKQADEPGDATRHAAMAAEKKADTIVAVGGDGMLNMVVNGILRQKGSDACAVGLIPFGTGNDFAAACGIPLDDFREAVDTLIRSAPLSIDLGQAGGRFFVNVVTGGFPAEAGLETSRTAKKLLGKFAYFVTGLVNIGSLEARDMHFSAPGFEWAGPVYAFGLANGRRVGGGFSVSPQAVVNDGLLDLMIIPESEEGLLAILAEYSRMSQGNNANRIITHQVPWLKLVSRETVKLNLDGEPVEGKYFHFRVHSGRLSFCLPKNSPVLIQE
jgi:lipid kinase YegS